MAKEGDKKYFVTDGSKYVNRMYGTEYDVTDDMEEAMQFDTFKDANDFRTKYRLDGEGYCAVLLAITKKRKYKPAPVAVESEEE